MRDRKKRKTQTRLDDKVLSWAAKKGRNNWLRGGLRSRRLARQLSTTQDKQRSSVRLAVRKVPSARHSRRETRSRVLFNCLLLLLRRAAQLTREVAQRNKQASSLRPNKSKVEYSRRQEGSARSRRGSRAVLVAKRDERLTTWLCHIQAACSRQLASSVQTEHSRCRRHTRLFRVRAMRDTPVRYLQVASCHSL